MSWFVNLNCLCVLKLVCVESSFFLLFFFFLFLSFFLSHFSPCKFLRGVNLLAKICKQKNKGAPICLLPWVPQNLAMPLAPRKGFMNLVVNLLMPLNCLLICGLSNDIYHIFLIMNGLYKYVHVSILIMITISNSNHLWNAKKVTPMVISIDPCIDKIIPNFSQVQSICLIFLHV